MKTWKLATPEHVASTPAVGADGTVYAGCQDDALYAIAPRPRVYLGVALAAALFMGLAAALIAEHNDGSIGRASRPR